MRYIETLKDGERISEVYLCKSKSTATTKAGKEYENVMLMDKTGQLDSKIWDPNSGGISDFDALDYVAITGQVTSFNGALQLKIDRIRKADEVNILNLIIFQAAVSILMICIKSFFSLQEVLKIHIFHHS